LESLEVLITVKTYPEASRSYEETVCTAGIRRDGGFVRLYPVRFRGLRVEQQYRKYQWVRVRAARNTSDPRPESYRPDLESLTTLGVPLPPDGNWRERKRLVLPYASASMEDLWDQCASRRTSLGLVRPAEVTDLTVEPCEREWEPGRLQWMRQTKLFGSAIKPLPRLPYRFRYAFRCRDPRCRGHESMIRDWELGSLYFKQLGRTGSESQAVDAVRHKFLNELFAPSKDSYLFMGNMREHENSWIVLGVFWPPREEQLTLGV
jgi:hypothetical protein